MKTSELTGAALDWAVTHANYEINFDYVWSNFRRECEYSTDWAQGGPIIEREWIEVVPWPNEADEGERWQATQHDLPHRVYCSGPTPLIAAMRCFVASRLGDEIEIPEELK
jgi:hypothetical protein